jgi:CheY-like chemotaxis protein
MDPLRERFRERAARDLELFRRHLAAGDLGAGAIETSAHKLAGAAAMFGFAGIGDAARAIDEAFAAGRRPSRRMLETLIARLAALNPENAGAEPAMEARGGSAGGETILIVEDDDLLRAHAERELGRLGYRVICAANGDELLERLEALPPVQLLFTDLMMPGAVSGEALAREVRRVRPEVRVLFTSGKAARGDRTGEAPMGNFLAKPYRRAALAAMVREVLDRPVDEMGGGGS